MCQGLLKRWYQTKKLRIKLSVFAHNSLFLRKVSPIIALESAPIIKRAPSGALFIISIRSKRSGLNDEIA